MNIPFNYEPSAHYGYEQRLNIEVARQLGRVPDDNEPIPLALWVKAAQELGIEARGWTGFLGVTVEQDQAALLCHRMRQRAVAILKGDDPLRAQWEQDSGYNLPGVKAKSDAYWAQVVGDVENPEALNTEDPFNTEFGWYSLFDLGIKTWSMADFPAEGRSRGTWDLMRRAFLAEMNLPA